MLKRNAMRWVKALRSGKYKQGKGKLKNTDDNSYCCLGVLGEINGIDSEHLERSGLLNGDTKTKCGIKDSSGQPYRSDKVSVPIKIKTKNKSEFACLTYANDDGATFEQIANWIEKNYKLL